MNKRKRDLTLESSGQNLTQHKISRPDVSTQVSREIETGQGNFHLENIPNGLVNDEVKAKKKKIPKTPPHLPKLPALVAAFGVCKSGKSNGLVNLINEYMRYGSLTHMYCISPTYHSNGALQTIPFVDENKKMKKEDAELIQRYYEPPSSTQNKNAFVGIFTDSSTCIEALDAITEHIKKVHTEYEDEKKYKKSYVKYKTNPTKLTIQEWAILQKEHFRAPLDLPWPSPGIFIDDMTHTALMANTINNKLSHLCLHHRHLDGVGVTIFQAFQTFKSGMPKVVRTNITAIMLFPTLNKKEIEDMYTEVGSSVSFDTFKKIFFEATKLPHSFLFINRMSDDPARQFGRNFNETFVVDYLAERRKILELQA